MPRTDMTHHQAIRKGLPTGWLLKLEQTEGLQIYLADYRSSKFTTTVYPAQAEYFRRGIDAVEMSLRITHLTGQRWVAVSHQLAPSRSNDRLTGAESRAALEAAIQAFRLENKGDDDDLDDLDDLDLDAVRTEWGTIRPQRRSCDGSAE
jgi:hypothetical protein